MIARLAKRLIFKSAPRLPLDLPKRFISANDIAAQKLLEEVYASVQSQRFEDIVVIETKNNADPRYLILANGFSFRHLTAGTEAINKHYKQMIKTPEQDFARLSISKEWNVIDFESIVVHLFSKECRRYFDIEQLWAVGEKYDDLTNFPEEHAPKSSSSILDRRTSESSG